MALFGLFGTRKEQAIQELKAEIAEIKANTRPIKPIGTGETTSNNLALQQMFWQLDQLHNLPIFDWSLKKHVDEGYIQNPHVYTCINKIIKPASQIPWCVYEVKDKKQLNRYLAYKQEGKMEEASLFETKALDRVEGTVLNRFFDERVNEFQTWTDFFIESLGYKLICGNRFMYGLAPAGYKKDEYSRLYNMPAQLTEIISGGWRKPISQYKIHLSPDSIEKIDASSVIHSKYFNPSLSFEFFGMRTNLYGLSPLAPLCRVYKRSNESYKAGYSMLKRGFPAGILSNKSGEFPMHQEDIEKLEKAWQDKYGGGDNSNKPAFTGGSFDWLKLGMSPVELDLIPANDADLQDIARAYSVPLSLVSESAATLDNRKEDEKSLWTNGIIPEMISLRNDLNSFLVPAWSRRDGKEYWVDFDSRCIVPLQAEMEVKSNRLRLEMEYGLWTPREVLTMLDQNDTGMSEHLDKYLLRNNLRFADEPMPTNQNNNGTDPK